MTLPTSHIRTSATGERSADDAPVAPNPIWQHLCSERQWKYSQRVLCWDWISILNHVWRMLSATSKRFLMLPGWPESWLLWLFYILHSMNTLNNKISNVFRPSTASQGSPLWSAHATLPKCTAMNATGELSADDAPVVAASRWQQFCSERQWILQSTCHIWDWYRFLNHVLRSSLPRASVHWCSQADRSVAFMIVLHFTLFGLSNGPCAGALADESPKSKIIQKCQNVNWPWDHQKSNLRKC